MKSYIIILLCLVSWQTISGQAFPDRHSTSWNEAWISCETSESPNVKRDPGHWIMYDLGDQYALHESIFWNNNVPGETDRGLNQIIIDLSNDGVNWTELGEYALTEGPASAFYEGDEGPNFEGEQARYILISAVSNHGGDCYSLSEVKINAAITTTTSYYENELNIDMVVTPNPATDFITAEISDVPTGAVKYQLTSSNGQLFANGSVKNTSFTIDVSSFPAGLYSLTVYNQSGTKSELITVITK